MPPNRRPPPKPWPMKYVVVAILVFVVIYTWVNLRYRKPGPGYRPYQDAQDRATVARLLAAGWHKMPVALERPIEAPALDGAPAAVARDFPGLGDLDQKFAEKPRLFASIDRVVSPASVRRGAEYTVYFTASVADLKEEMGELALFRRDRELVLLPTTEHLPGRDLRSRWNDSNYTARFSTADLAPGRYEARLVARGRAATWSFTVK
ncbi:MAG TPA: hypothetical protein VHD61_14305 [Lacunisphaera sp.]|nr:hypothetical protein [Lacunisphaera sp.]